MISILRSCYRCTLRHRCRLTAEFVYFDLTARSGHHADGETVDWPVCPMAGSWEWVALRRNWQRWMVKLVSTPFKASSVSSDLAKLPRPISSMSQHRIVVYTSQRNTGGRHWRKCARSGLAVDVPGVGFVVVGGRNDDIERLSTAELVTVNTEGNDDVNWS
uniref:DUF5641 domain-containing protein n=1 Tax=Mesocestoides corti TaxID=53468 RepID=A0A5K3FPZ6_MESCO